MIIYYVLKGFGRHKMRTAILVMALMVVTAMLVTLNNGVESIQRQVVNIVETEVGEHDIAVTRAETSSNQFVDIAALSEIFFAADTRVKAVYPRFMAEVELRSSQRTGNASLVARTDEDELGQITLLEGAYDLVGDKVVLARGTADSFGLEVGDTLDMSYILPLSRLSGYEFPSADSVGRISRRFTVSGIALISGLGEGRQNSILASVDTVQDWLVLSGRAQSLVIVLDDAVYNAVNTQTSIFRVRRIAENLQDALGNQADSYAFALDKAKTLDFTDIAFAVLRSVSNIYGFLVMGVVGLLIYSMINTNVEERRRDLAFLRILGARQVHLFGLVLVEVAILGAVGVGVGIFAGQIFSLGVVAPLTNYLIGRLGQNSGREFGIDFQMTITLAAMWRAAVTATIVLAISAIAPARKAARTKVRYAINPGSADNLQIDDLARLRSRRFDMRIVVAGVVLTIMWGLIFVGTNFLYVQGNEAIISAFMFGGLALLVIGISLLFYALTIPFEYILILLSRWLVPRLAFFAGPNLVRAKQRNTMISLMVVFSATLPTFLGTMAALEQRNYDTAARFTQGAPVTVSVSRWSWSLSADMDNLLHPKFLQEFYEVPGIERVVGLTSPHNTPVTNKVELRNVGLQVYGLTGSLDDIIYRDLTEYYAGGPEIFEHILAEPDAIILGAGYAEFMDLEVGDVLLAQGVGKDHLVRMRVVGLIERMAGFESFSRNENYVRWGSSPGLVSLDTYLRLTQDPTLKSVCVGGFCSPLELDAPIIAKVMAVTDSEEDDAEIVSTLREMFADRSSIWVQSTEESIRSTEQTMRTMRVLMLVMTVLSFVTSIFGVFAVVYVAVYVRRLEIGMLKAIGMQRGELVGTFALESVMMTVSASLAGVAAGTVLGYVFYMSENIMRNIPTKLTFDWMTTLAILVMVILASVASAVFAARSSVRRKVTEILREAW